MGIDAKYGRVTVENVRLRPIADDEPVFLFRAQDALLPALLEMYHHMCVAAGSPAGHLDGIDEGIRRVRAWQAEHYIQTPGSTPATADQAAQLVTAANIANGTEADDQGEVL